MLSKCLLIIFSPDFLGEKAWYLLLYVCMYVWGRLRSIILCCSTSIDTGYGLVVDHSSVVDCLLSIIECKNITNKPSM